MKKRKSTSIENDPSEQEKLGTYRLGALNVDLYVWPHNVGAEFYLSPDPTSLPRIKIGLCYAGFDSVLNCLLHEVLEFKMTLDNLRYKQCGGYPGGDVYTFMLTHAQFTSVVCDASIFVEDVYAPLRKRWQEVAVKLKQE